MAGLAALQKYSCPACGGEAVWRPEKHILACAFCGAESVIANPPAVRDAPPKHSLALLPVWLLTYRYAGKPYQVTVNGATGEIAGNYPYSPVKVALAIFLFVEIYLFFQDPEFAVKLPFWLIDSLWWLISKPFTS